MVIPVCLHYDLSFSMEYCARVEQQEIFYSSISASQ